MNKAEMIEHIAAENDLSKAAASKVFDTMVNIIHTDLKKTGRCSISNLGTFTVTRRAARTGRNPATGEAVKIKASNNAKFKAAPVLKETIAKFKAK